jgi:PhnB protein
MQVHPYLSFNGQCEEAFRVYEQCLGGQIGPVFRYGGSPMDYQVPSDWENKVMHGSMTVGGQVLMGGDVAPDRYEAPNGFSLSIHLAKATGQSSEG